MPFQLQIFEVDISIHALREEGDRDLLTVQVVNLDISIHALREEGDATPAHTSTS